MRNLKKFLALVLAMMMAMSLMVTANAVTENVEFSDTNTVIKEFRDDVIVLSGMGVIKGHGDTGTFAPKGEVTRAQMAAIVYRLATGDASDQRSDLYKEYHSFSDVKSTAWYAGYVGYCADAGYIQGYPDGTFKPDNKVTGYQALAMILRAMGYNEPGHNFTGSTWKAETGATATQRGMLATINKTIYANTLNNYAPRELVAEMAFQGATKAMVQYTNAFGYQTTGMRWDGNSAGVTSSSQNPSLGELYYGLASLSGHIVANQATGEPATLLGFSRGASISTATSTVSIPMLDGNGNLVKEDEDGNILTKPAADAPEGEVKAYEDATPVMIPIGTTTTEVIDTPARGSYDYAGGVPFNFNTGLDMFAHSAVVWYNFNSFSLNKGYETYALIDKAVEPNEYIYSSGTTIGGVSGATRGSVLWSDRYSQIGSLLYTENTNLSQINTYSIVHNPDADVYIALNAEVGVVEEKNTTATVPYLTLGSTLSTSSWFGNSSDGTQINRIHLSKLTSDTKDAQKETGALVTAYQIMGTSFTLTTAPTVAGDDLAKIMYQLDPMKTKTVTVATYKAPDSAAINGVTDHVTELTPVGGDTMNLSGITEKNRIISHALPIATKTAGQTEGDYVGANIVPLAGMTYTVYEDLVGRFISLVPVAETKFVYGTYAGYELDGFNAGTIKYNMVGVGWDAKEQTEDTIKLLGTTSVSGDEVPITGVNYNTLAVTKKDQGQVVGQANFTPGNEIKTGVNTGYMYNASTGALYTQGLDGTAMDNTTWNFTSADAGYGFKKVNSDSVDYLVTNDTEFIIVTGTGTATLNVETAKGITGLLAGGTSADITKTALGGATDPITGDMNNVYFQTDTDLFGTVHTGDNAVILKVILSDGNLTRWNAQTLYFNYTATGTTAPTGVKLPGVAASRNVEQFELWNNGEKGYYFIDLDASLTTGNVAWNASANVEVQTFYTLAKIDDVNGIPVYRAVALTNPAKVDYLSGHNSMGTGADPVIYNYITVNNLSTAQLTKGTAPNHQLVYSISSDVKVCDVQWLTTANAAATLNRNKITNIRELNNAVSVMLTNGTTAAYNNIQVAVVYDGSVITCIYVTTVPAIGT